MTKDKKFLYTISIAAFAALLSSYKKTSNRVHKQNRGLAADDGSCCALRYSYTDSGYVFHLLHQSLFCNE